MILLTQRFDVELFDAEKLNLYDDIISQLVIYDTGCADATLLTLELRFPDSENFTVTLVNSGVMRGQYKTKIYLTLI